MSDVVIRAEGLGKKYLIGHETQSSLDNTLRDTLVSATRRMRRSASDLIRGRQLVVGDEVEEFWALKDVDFEIRRGDVVGIIGRNGAGKSTLLKILSRITEPTEGKVTMDGRVASLLEVGTGFHPELSGRENIFLNGSILGMTRKEIQAKFDEIVDFAGVEKFIDTPVKRYSSGMKVRLGFSVAAHLEPEILIVDEVLAVGDAVFQQKCLGKMQEVAGDGRTVLFVSHNMTAVSSLCSRAVLLSKRTKGFDGKVDKCISMYMSKDKSSVLDFNKILSLTGEKNKNVTIKTIKFSAGDEGQFKNPVCGKPCEIVLRFQGSSTKIHNGRIGIAFFNEAGQLLFNLASECSNADQLKLSVNNEIICRIPKFPLPSGRYYMNFFLEVDGIVNATIKDCLHVDVQDGSFYETPKNLPTSWNANVVLIDNIWKSQSLQNKLS